MSETLFHHVCKEDLRDGSARDVDPPYASFDVVLRMDYEHLAVRLLDAQNEVSDLKKRLGYPEFAR